MKDPCLDFRARLASALTAHPGPATTELAWHDHLLFCTDCRALLDAEEALDDLLKSLPRPSLPPELVKRVLVRLRPVRDDFELDRLLDNALAAESGGEVAAPPGLAGAVLAGLSEARAQARRSQREEAALDALLDELAPTPTPVGLAARTLAALAQARERSRHEPLEHALDGVEFIGASELIGASTPPSVAGARKRISIVPATRKTSPPPRRTHAAPSASVARRQPFSTPARSLLVAASLAALIGGGAWVWAAFGPGSREPSDQFAHNDGVQSPSVAPRGSQNGAPDNGSREDQPREDQPRQDRPDVAARRDQLATNELPKEQRSTGGAPVLDLVEPDAELLAQLELLESWDVLTDETLDFELVGIDENTLLGLQTATTLDADPAPATGDDPAPTPAGTGKG